MRSFEPSHVVAEPSRATLSKALVMLSLCLPLSPTGALGQTFDPGSSATDKLGAPQTSTGQDVPPPAGHFFAEEAVVTRPEKGALVIDGSNGKSYVDIQPTGMSFDSGQDAVKWAMDNLNALPFYNKQGKLLGVYGYLEHKGELNYPDEKRQAVWPVNDYVAAILGGQSGVMQVGSRGYCLNKDGCAPNVTFKAAPPANATECATTDEDFCVRQESWKTNLLGIYRSVGSELEQSKGGYRETDVFCWKWGFIPWVCSQKRGDNELQIHNLFKVPGGAAGRRAEAKNVEEVSQRLWSLFVSVETSTEYDSLHPGDIATTREGDVGGVCADGRARQRGVTMTQTFSSRGSVPDACSTEEPIFF